MRLDIRLLVFLFLSMPAAGFSQRTGTLINKPDSLSRKTDSAGGQVNNINPNAIIKTPGSHLIVISIYRAAIGEIQFGYGGAIFCRCERIQKGALKLRENNPNL